MTSFHGGSPIYDHPQNFAELGLSRRQFSLDISTSPPDAGHVCFGSVSQGWAFDPLPRTTRSRGCGHSRQLPRHHVDSRATAQNPIRLARDYVRSSDSIAGTAQPDTAACSVAVLVHCAGLSGSHDKRRDSADRDQTVRQAAQAGRSTKTLCRATLRRTERLEFSCRHRPRTEAWPVAGQSSITQPLPADRCTRATARHHSSGRRGTTNVSR